MFYYWLRKDNEAHRPSEKGFVPVEVGSPVLPPVNEPRGNIQIHYSNCVLVSLDKLVDISWIRALIKPWQNHVRKVQIALEM